MEVKAGYKQTEVGVIPQDWGTDTMLRISHQIMDYRGRTPKKLGMEWGGGDIPALSAGNVKKGFVDFGEECYFGSDELYRQWMTKGDVAKDDILFTTEAPLGNVALVPDDRRYILSQRTVLLQVDPRLASSTFLFQMMLSDRFQRMLADYSSGSTAKGIQRKKFERLSVALPPLPEQRAIAAALSDVDALLGGLDRLIAKKRDLKRAAMQQLLTGQTRLPGFPGEWEVKRLGETGTFLKGSGVKKDEANSGDLPCIRYGEIYTHHNDYIRSFNSWISSEVAATATKLRQGDLLFAGSGETKEEIGKCVAFVDDREAFAGGDIVILRLADANPIFMGYYCNTAPINAQKASKGQGDAVVHISAAALSSIEVTLPSREEQTAIAAVLSDMDAELAALESRRDKTRALKQAMMQELLTGKTRLLSPDAETKTESKR
jgi:type I restriction enzyme S subunit